MQLSRRTLLTGALAAVPAALVVTGASAPANAATATGAAAGADAGGLASTGRPVVQDIQRQLIARYGARTGFPEVATDGRWTGATLQALIHGLQLELGLAEDVANGSFGPLTRSTLRASVPQLALGATDGATWFVHLLQAALVGSTTWDGPVDGTFSAEQSDRLRRFQRFVALPETGRADFSTWASLLSSDGDPDRAGTAVDCITTITAARAATLTADGYGIVGRYLTDTPVEDALRKQLQDGELEVILDAGLRVFPIFQEGGTDTAAFSYERGVYSAGRAHEAASRLGFLPGTTIYYAVDFDATRDQVERYIQPYFRGVHDQLARLGSPYDVGIYAGREVCARISAAHLATYSFVAGMSAAWGSNRGHRLPDNWAFDQILEHTIGTGDGAIGIDTNIVSGRDRGQGSLATTR